MHSLESDSKILHSPFVIFLAPIQYFFGFIVPLSSNYVMSHYLVTFDTLPLQDTMNWQSSHIHTTETLT